MESDSSFPPLSGGCRCGAVRYEITGTPKFQLSCHCRDCQYASGGGPSHVMVVAKERFSLLEGEPRVFAVRLAGGQRVERMFCEICGTPLFAQSQADEHVIAVKAGSLDEPSRFRPQAEIWVASAPDWVRHDASLPQLRGQLQPNLEALFAWGRAMFRRVTRAT